MSLFLWNTSFSTTIRISRHPFEWPVFKEWNPCPLAPLPTFGNRAVKSWFSQEDLFASDCAYLKEKVSDLMSVAWYENVGDSLSAVSKIPNESFKKWKWMIGGICQNNFLKLCVNATSYIYRRHTTLQGWRCWFSFTHEFYRTKTIKFEFSFDIKADWSIILNDYIWKIWRCRKMSRLFNQVECWPKQQSV